MQKYKLKNKEYFILIMGQSPDSKTYNKSGIGLPFFQGKKEFGEVSPIVEQYCSNPIRVAAAGDILLSVRAPVGPTNLADQKCCIGRGLSAIRPNKEHCTTSYLLYYFKKFQVEIANLGKGSTFDAITKADLENIEIPLPPLSIQHAIVAKLDEASASINSAKSAIQDQIDALDVLWQSSLSGVFEGKYPMKMVEELCTKITDGTHATPKYINSGVPFLSVKNITGGVIDFGDTRFISQEEHEQLTKRCKPELNDLLYTKVGTTGIAKVIDTEKEFSIFVSLALLKPKHNIIWTKFFEYMLNSPKAYEQAQSRTRGVANRNLVINDIKQIIIPLPTLPEQQQIVSDLDELSQTINNLKTVYKQQLADYDTLWASILDKAFRGELVL